MSEIYCICDGCYGEYGGTTGAGTRIAILVQTEYKYSMYIYIYIYVCVNNNTIKALYWSEC